MSCDARMRSIAALLAVIAAVALFAPSARAAELLFKFDELIGVPRPFTGTVNAIRGVPGGGLPWVIERGDAKLHADGKIQVKVRGLVLDPNDPDVIAAGRAGVNPSPVFKAIVSCLTVDGLGDAVIENVATGEFPATTGFGGGDSEIKDIILLPEPCIAPIVFVTSATGSWFAASGF